MTIDGGEVGITCVDCTLFAGRLDIDFGSLDSSDGGGAIRQISVGNEIEYSALHDRVITIEDSRNTNVEDSSATAWFDWNREVYRITSLRIDRIQHAPESQQLSLSLNLATKHHENGGPIAVKAELIAECVSINASFLRLRMSVVPTCIPIRFASHYLPIVGLPELPVGTTRDQVIALFGLPIHEGGGHHPKFGDIPVWSTHFLSNWVIRFEFAAEQVTNFMICPASDNPGIRVDSTWPKD